MWGRGEGLGWLCPLTNRTEAVVGQNTRREACRLRRRADALLNNVSLDGYGGSDGSAVRSAVLHLRIMYLFCLHHLSPLTLYISLFLARSLFMY